MKSNNIVILHVFQDGLIFKGVANAYDSMPGVVNLYYYYSPQKNFKLQNIKDDRVRITHDLRTYTDYFSDPDIDVIVFYSLPYKNYYLFDHIDDKKLVIWWAWGYDLYYGQGDNKPLISTGEMLKPLTQKFVNEKINIAVNQGKIISKGLEIGKRLYRYIINRVFDRNNYSPKPRKTQKEILSRIDFFYAPLEFEYVLMRENHPYFTAKGDFGINSIYEPPFIYKEKIGNVLVNHSLTHTDNHLDVFEYLYKVKMSANRKFILPVSYGTGGNYRGNPNYLINNSRFEADQAIWLTKTLPYVEYKELVASVSHAVFGTLRQQALGNIYMCLRSGVKVYLFKDSVVYKELKKLGYIVFSIEDDYTIDSLNTCLSEVDAKNNYDINISRMRQYYPQKALDILVKAIASKNDISLKN